MRSFLRAVFLMVLSTVAYGQSEGFRFGELRFGMSVDEARAARPDVAWTAVDRHAETGRTYVVRGAGAVTLGGLTFDLELGSRALGNFLWRLGSKAASRNATECELRTLAVVAELERHFGAFAPPAEPAHDQTLLSAGTASHVVAGAFDARMKAIGRERAGRSDPENSYVRARHEAAGPDDARVHLNAGYERDPQRICAIDIEIKRSASVLDETDVVSTDKILARPTISYRNRTLRQVGAPKETLRYSIPCSMHAGSGKISLCHSAPGDPYHAVAVQWALHYQFARENSQPDDERQLAVVVPIEMGPADLRTANVTTGRRLDLAQVRIKRPGGGGSAPNMKLETPVEVPVLCEVMEDGSLLCDVKPGTTVHAALSAAAVDAASRMEVDVLLRDGTSAVGGVIERTITFRPGKS